jgi:GH25 family lysozyme M1 (1,4-beta-N-acetylmuramidase)
MPLKFVLIFVILVATIGKERIMAKNVLKRGILPVFLVLILTVSTLFPGFSATIKTQKAADAIEGGIRGIDVSKYNGEINWRQVAQDDVSFAFIRASVGVVLRTGYELNKDPMFEYNATQALANGIEVGAYHHACFTSEARMRSEAEVFLEQLRLVDITYPVSIDQEINPARLSRERLTELTRQFADIISRAGYTVMIYSYQNFIRDNIDVEGLGNYKLWLANYNETPKYIAHSIWQYTSSGRVSGIGGPVDLNVLYPNFRAKLWKNTSVSRTISNGIKENLSDRYGRNVPASGLSGIHRHVNAAMQMELNRQLDAGVAVTGTMGPDSLDALASISFGSGTQGWITYLLQSKLFFMGFYKVAPSGRFDGRTSEALRDFQYANGLHVNGQVNDVTVYTLFG